jgi:hypothetical protein
MGIFPGIERYLIPGNYWTRKRAPGKCSTGGGATKLDIVSESGDGGLTGARTRRAILLR